MITVGATRFDGIRASYSNFGDSIDIMAPGGDMSIDQNADGQPDGVLSTFANDYQFEEGTSMSAPHVTGIVGLLVSAKPTLVQSDVEQILKD